MILYHTYQHTHFKFKSITHSKPNTSYTQVWIQLLDTKDGPGFNWEIV
jgi:hypothetical protein